MIDNKFNIKEKVILPVEVVPGMIGRIIGIWVCEDGIQYKVRYFYQGKAEEIYFYEDELTRGGS